MPAAVTRLALLCQGATAATRAAAFQTNDDALDAHALDALPRVRAVLGWRGSALAAPSRAAHETAAALTSHVVTEPDLRDCDYGRWVGRSMSEIEAREPDALAIWLSDPAAAPHGGEALTSVLVRLRHWLDRCVATPENRLAVTSPLIVRALIVAALDLPVPTFWQLDAAPLTLSRLTAQGGRWRLAALNAPP